MARKVRRTKNVIQIDFDDRSEIPEKGRTVLIKALNQAQKRYDAAIRSSDIIFGIGPAGTGKTWFSCMRAAEAMKAGNIERIIVTRPNVEADGEGMGYLPGDLGEKFAPYLEPVRSVFIDAFGKSHFEYLLKTEKIRAVPLGFMRGMSIRNAWVIADEMQNATIGQLKMLLTRGEDGVKFIVDGDNRQIDIEPEKSGLLQASRLLENVAGVSVVLFDNHDIVRSGLTQRVVEAFEA